MIETSPVSQDGFRIDVSADRMKVVLSVEQGATVSTSDIISALREMKVARFDDGMIIEAVETRKGGPLMIEVAAGTAPVDDRPERVDYRVPVAHGLSRISTKVAVGQIIATILPGTPGTDGIDVFGQPVPCKKNDKPLTVGRNLTVGKGIVACEHPGNLRLHDNVLSVEPLLEMRGDEGSAAPINFDGDAVIRGSLIDGCSLQITGSLSVGGALEAVELKAGGSVLVQGGLIGKGKGRYIIGEDLRCRFISGSFVLAGEDVQVQSDIIDSRITCSGRLVVNQGVIFGGAVAANGGLTCLTLGRADGTPTLIEAGEGIAIRSHLAFAGAQIEANRKRICSVRAKIEPLLKMMKTLTASQREKVTELLYEADELEEATNKLVAEMDRQTRSLSEKALSQVVVEKAVYPGVTVRFPLVKTTFTTAFKGPFSIEPQKSNGVTEIVCIDRTNQSRMVLPSHPVDLAVEDKSLDIPSAKAA